MTPDPSGAEGIAVPPGGGADVERLATRALAAARRPQRFGAWYVAEHRFRIMRAYAQTVVVTGIGSPLLYLAGLGLGLGALVSANLGPRAVDGVAYLPFVAPALLVTAAVQTALEEYSYPILLGFKWNPIFTGMHSAPLTPGQIIDGNVIAVTGRLLATCGIYFLVMLPFGAVPLATGVVAIPVAMLAGAAVGSPVLAYVATIREDRGQIPVLARVVILPLTLFSGTFFPLSVLPLGLQWIGWLSPVWHGAQLARVATFGLAEPVWLTVVHVVYLAVLAVVPWRLARRTTARRLAS